MIQRIGLITNMLKIQLIMKSKRPRPCIITAILTKNSGNSREIWRTINQAMSCNTKTDNSITSIKTEERLISDTNEIAEVFNQHFTDIGPRLASKLDNSSKSFEEYITTTRSSFHLQAVDRDTVLKVLTSVSPAKATGLDEIPCCLIRDLKHQDGSGGRRCLRK